MSSTRIPERRLEPRKLPKQARSETTVQAILEAAAQIFERHGYAAGTTNRIAERAGVSIGSLYQYFPNKDAILVALVHEHLAESMTVLQPHIEDLHRGASFDEVLQGIVEGMVAMHALAPGLHRVLFEETQLPQKLRAELDDLEDRLVDLAADALAAGPRPSSADPRPSPTDPRSSPTGPRSSPTGPRSSPTGPRSSPADPRSSPTDPRLTARVVIGAIEGLTHRLVLRAPPGVTPETIAHEITELVRAYIALA